MLCYFSKPPIFIARVKIEFALFCLRSVVFPLSFIVIDLPVEDNLADG